MSSTYRRLSKSEIDSKLKQRKSREERIDFLKWLLLQDEEACKIWPEEDSEYAYINFNQEGVRSIRFGIPEIEEMEKQDQKTKAYREFLQNRLDYWENAKTGHGPFPEEGEIADVDEGFDHKEPESQPLQRIEWKGGKSDLVYLFTRLRKEGFLGMDFKANPWVLLKQHFKLKEGDELSNLKQTRQN